MNWLKIGDIEYRTDASGITTAHRKLETKVNTAKIVALQDFSPTHGTITEVKIEAESKNDVTVALVLLKSRYGSPAGIKTNGTHCECLWVKPLSEWRAKVHDKLGKERMDELCKEYGLSQSEKLCLSEVLLVYQFYPLKLRSVHYIHIQLRDLTTDRREKVVNCADAIRDLAKHS